MEHQGDPAAVDVVESELVDELLDEPARAIGAELEAVSPFAGAQPMRVSAEVLTADDPAAALACPVPAPPSQGHPPRLHRRPDRMVRLL